MMKYAVSVGAVSLGVCVVLQTVEFMNPGFLGKVVVKEREDGGGGHTVEKIASAFLLLWWSIGTGIITFSGEQHVLLMFVVAKTIHQV